MLHDFLGRGSGEIKDFLDNHQKYLSLSGGIWRHRTQDVILTKPLISVVLDKFFAEKFKNHIISERPKNGAFANKNIYRLIEGHKDQGFLLTTDIYKYFPSIGFHLVEDHIARCPHLKDHHDVVKLVFFGDDNSLRVGLFASPAISEIVGVKIDNTIQNLLHSNRLTFKIL